MQKPETGQKTGSRSRKFFSTKVAEFNNMFDGLIKFMIFQGHIRNFTKLQNVESHNNNWVAVKTSLKINLARSKIKITLSDRINTGTHNSFLIHLFHYINYPYSQDTPEFQKRPLCMCVFLCPSQTAAKEGTIFGGSVHVYWE